MLSPPAVLTPNQTACGFSWGGMSEWMFLSSVTSLFCFQLTVCCHSVCLRSQPDLRPLPPARIHCVQALFKDTSWGSVRVQPRDRHITYKWTLRNPQSTGWPPTSWLARSHRGEGVTAGPLGRKVSLKSSLSRGGVAGVLITALHLQDPLTYWAVSKPPSSEGRYVPTWASLMAATPKAGLLSCIFQGLGAGHFSQLVFSSFVWTLFSGFTLLQFKSPNYQRNMFTFRSCRQTASSCKGLIMTASHVNVGPSSCIQILANIVF